MEIGRVVIFIGDDGGWIRIGRWQEIKKACIARATRECVITMRTVINTIRESLITFQTFACRTIRGEIVFLARFKKGKKKTQVDFKYRGEFVDDLDFLSKTSLCSSLPAAGE